MKPQALATTKDEDTRGRQASGPRHPRVRPHPLALALVVLTAPGCTRTAIESPPEPPAPRATPEPDPEPTAARAQAEAPTEPARAPAVAAEDATPGGVTPLSDAQREVFLGSPEDKPTEVRLGVTKAREGKQYLAGNEKTLQAFYPRIKDLGGGYIGVGSDQAYILIGWAKPDFAWFIDYDADVVAMHAVYRAFLLGVDTPDEFLALWTEDGRATGKRLLAAQITDPKRLKRLRHLYLRYRGWILRRLTAVKKRMVEDGVPTFLNDQATYDHIRDMLHAGRIRPMVTNLFADQGVNGIAAAARELNVPIRLLYLSNAEEYWQRYDEQFKRNVEALPFDERGLVLRTLLTWAANGDYVYNTQPGENFKRWLKNAAIRNVYDIAHARTTPVPDEINTLHVDTEPEDSPAVRKAAARRTSRGS